MKDKNVERREHRYFVCVKYDSGNLYYGKNGLANNREMGDFWAVESRWYKTRAAAQRYAEKEKAYFLGEVAGIVCCTLDYALNDHGIVRPYRHKVNYI